jgi:adenosylcobinamide-GDP ribazoletransferase
MKDSRIGTYGALALILVMFSKICLLVLLCQIDINLALMSLFIAHVISRFTPLFLIRTMEHVGSSEQSKSKPLAESISTKSVLVGSVWWILAMVVSSSMVAIVPLCAGAIGAVAAALWMAWRLKTRLQGFTGDGLGATQQLSEIGFYLGAVLALGVQ